MIFDAKEAFNRTLKALSDAERQEIERVMSCIAEATLKGSYITQMRMEENLSNKTIETLIDKGYSVKKEGLIDSIHIHPIYLYEIRWDEPYTIRGEN